MPQKKRNNAKKGSFPVAHHHYMAAFFIASSAVIYLSFRALPHSRAEFEAVPLTIYQDHTVVLSGYSPVKIPRATTARPPLFAPAAYTAIDVTTHSLLLGKNTDTKRPIASLTKLMTVLVALDHVKLTDAVTVRGNYTDLPAHKLGLVPGDTILVQDLLTASLVSSSNDAAAVLSEAVSPGKPLEFIRLMNEKATELGMSNTHFSNMIGLDQGDNYSTAGDLAILARAAISHPEVMREVGKENAGIVWNSGNKKAEIRSTNALLTDKDFRVLGLKTGSTPLAGECFITLTEIAGNQVITVVLGSSARFVQTKEMLAWIAQNISWE
ncbi:MAG: serine hydrolase [Patescibacteria group bacterium]